MARRFFFNPVDIAVLLYLGLLTALIIIFADSVSAYAVHFVFFAGVVAFVLIQARWGPAPSGARRFFRLAYPPILYTFFYRMNAPLVLLIFPDYFDPLVNAFEKWLFGIYPTVFLLRFDYALTNDLIQLCYISYYFLIPIAALTLYFKKKYFETEELIFTVSVTFYVCYVGFVLFPVEGPRLAMPEYHPVALKGIVFTPLAHWIIENAGLHGGCMPSSHSAVAVVILLFMLKYERRIGYILAPFVIGLFIGTFHGRFHYVSDTVAGIAVGVTCYRLRGFLSGGKYGHGPPIDPRSPLT